MSNFRKTKRYHGKKANVEENIFFEDYMDNVAKGVVHYIDGSYLICK